MLRERVGERGAAMMLAILFVVVVLTTSTLVMTVLVAQAVPYKANKENAQANYAAESGLEVGLSYLNETLAGLKNATSLDELKNLLPSANADVADSSKDGQFTVYEGASALLNNVPLNTVTSRSDVTSYTPDDLSYRVRINFYATDPDSASAKMISSPSDLKSLQYAEVVATGFINRYKDGRTAGNAQKPQAMKRAICKIEAKTDSTTTNHSSTLGVGGRMGMGFYAAAPYNRLDSQFVWVPVDYDGVSIGTDPTGAVKFAGTVDSGHTNTSQLSDGTATLNPVNRTCMLATTTPVTNEKQSISENLDLSKSPQAGSGLVILPVAYNAGGDTYQYTEECRADGAYSSLNTWVYYKDNSIRLASNMGLCVTGVSVDDADGKTPATLQPCGTSGSRAITIRIQVRPRSRRRRTIRTVCSTSTRNGISTTASSTPGIGTSWPATSARKPRHTIPLCPKARVMPSPVCKAAKKPSSSVWKSPITVAVRKTAATRISRAATSKPPPTARRTWCRSGPTTSATPTSRTAPTCRTPPRPSARPAKRGTAPTSW